ncbi:hypothetical protein TNCT_54221 [Trichonephila clavata]|uniref:Uncharacterized protein n=1 Tax=Trichonephila clavata TaxID=2740835 RepID=A0A8X6I3I4_TRICU|nr:hypothetical protein TNCT_54221 [Trichonephila clavata]
MLLATQSPHPKLAISRRLEDMGKFENMKLSLGFFTKRYEMFLITYKSKDQTEMRHCRPDGVKELSDEIKESTAHAYVRKNAVQDETENRVSFARSLSLFWRIVSCNKNGLL